MLALALVLGRVEVSPSSAAQRSQHQAAPVGSEDESRTHQPVQVLEHLPIVQAAVHPAWPISYQTLTLG